jgi:hypothetical protein
VQTTHAPGVLLFVESSKRKNGKNINLVLDIFVFMSIMKPALDVED